MIRLLLTAAALLIAPAAFAQADAPLSIVVSENAPTASTQTTAKPDALLVRLDHSLTKARDAKSNGRLNEKDYQKFAAKFRGGLAEAMGRIKPSPANTALHARILSHLDDPRQAMSELGAAIKSAPGNIDLRVAASQIEFDRKDYPAALAQANAALEIDPQNREALMFKHFSQGRMSPASDADTGPSTSP
ncbi:MAG: hypothetical protein KGJ84_12205 [Elusimicrobia bacterium]|nr:hypothetical protein [Elusimicrobiota bacterium]